MNSFVLVLVFVVSALVGYKVIKNIPSLLHTPLMSGMNALSGITLIGALVAISQVEDIKRFLSGSFVRQVSDIFGISPMLQGALAVAGLAAVLATINVVGGFRVTHRMLRMFDKKKGRGGAAVEP